MTTLLGQIRKPLQDAGAFAAISDSVEQTTNTIEAVTMQSDPNFELMVYRRRSDMSEVEAIYYYIRNAFAHGMFEVKDCENARVYLLESRKNNIVKARMRLKETTLLHYAELSKLSASQVRSMQKKK